MNEAGGMGDEQFVDQSNYQMMVGTSNDKDLSFKTILLEHIRRLAILSSKDFDEGGYIKRTTFLDNLNRPVTTETYIPSHRKAFINSIRFLRDLIQPYITKKTKLKDNAVWNENNDALLKALEKCKKIDEDYAKSDKPPTADQVRLQVEAYRDLFLEINTFCVFNKYFGKVGIRE